MKKSTIGKAAAAAAAFVLIAGGTVYARGRIAYYTASSSNLTACTSYTDIEKLEKQAGYEFRSVEAFENGFAFEQAEIVAAKSHDDGGGVLDRWNGVTVDYTDDAGRAVVLSIDPEACLSDEETDAVYESRIAASKDGEVEMRYSEYTYLVVPDEDMLTAEQLQRAQEDPNFWVSVGSDEVEEGFYRTASFTIDGVCYSFGTEDDLDQETMFDMAQELIAQ